MDREILFRGKRLGNGEWVEGSYMEHYFSSRFGCVSAIFTNDDVLRKTYRIPVDPSTVGQYTGKSDRDQHRAFVGDIVRYRDEHHTAYGVIRFGETPDTWGRSKHIGFYVEWQNDGANAWGDWWRSDLGFWLDNQHCEICGNIHDNPELMGGEGDG